MNQHDHKAIAGVVELLRAVGENPEREGLQDTPKRVLKAFKERTVGYQQDAAKILSTTFEDTCEQMVVLSGIPFQSLCEHHLLGFAGTVDVAYLPGDRVVGLSKLARVVDCFANRLQIQERLTQQISKAIHLHLRPKGVGVVVRAHHSCMSCRGVMKTGTTMITSDLVGSFRLPEVRAEFLSLIAGNS